MLNYNRASYARTSNIDDATRVLPLPVHFAILKAGRQKRLHELPWM